MLTPIENDELAQIADALRERTPPDSDALEPLIQLVGGQLWRRRKAYAGIRALWGQP